MTVATGSIASAPDMAQAYTQNVSRAEKFQTMCEAELKKFFKSATPEDNEDRIVRTKADKVSKAAVTGPLTGDSLLNTMEINDFSLFGMQDEMAANSVMTLFPNQPVQEEKGHWYVYDRASNNRIYDDDWTEISDGGKSKSVQMKLSDDQYQCKEYGINMPLTPRTEANAMRTNQNLTEARARYLGAWAVKQRARQITKVLQDTSSFRALTTTTPATKWNAGGNWVKDIDNAVLEIYRRTGMMPNRAMMNLEVFLALRHNSHTLALTNGTSAPSDPALISPQNLAAFVGLDQIVVATGIETTSDPDLEGIEDDFTSNFLASANHFTLFYAPASVGTLSQSAVCNFSMNGIVDYTDMGTRTRMYEDIETEAEVMEIRTFYQPKVIDKDLGGILQSVI